MNKFIASGRLVADPQQIAETAKGKVMVFKLAVDTRRDQTDFPEFKVFGKVGSHVAEYLKKGYQVEVEAEFRTERFEHEGKEEFRESFHVIGFPNITSWPKKSDQQ